MSHVATNWAFQQRGLKPSAWRVLAVLADCHNPAHGCFPTQAFLADACEINRDTVNAQLNLLEERGLIRRIRRVDPQTRRQRPTRYKLAFEADFDAAETEKTAGEAVDNSVSENPTQPEAVSEIPAEPCRKNAESRVGKPDTNPVIEPVIKPSRAGGPAREAGTDAERLVAFERFWQEHPKSRKRERSLELWLEAEKTGVDLHGIISEAVRYRQVNQGRDTQYLISSDRWLEQRRWEGEPGKPQPSQDERARGIEATAEHLTQRFIDGAFVPVSAWTPAILACVRARGLVSIDQLRAAGVRV